MLQVLQSGGVRGRWSLKSPHHVLHLDALTAVYPDARIVVMHRDPLVLSASVCSLISTLSGTFSDADHTAYIAEHWTDMLARSVDALNTFRDANPQVPIVDVQYAELVGDPLATMERVYGAFDDELTGQAADAMRAHVDSRPKGRFGTHRYDLDEFGLDGPGTHRALRRLRRALPDPARVSRLGVTATGGSSRGRVSATDEAHHRRRNTDDTRGQHGTPIRGRRLPTDHDRPRRRRIGLGVAVLLAVALVAGACSSGRSSDAGDGGTATTTSRGGRRVGVRRPRVAVRSR